MSNWLPYAFILIAIALVLGPVMMMRPSQRQQQQLKFRNSAAAQGLRVHMLPLPSVGPGGKQGPSRPCAAYCLPWPKDQGDKAGWLLLKGGYEHEIHFQGVWQWAEGQQAEPHWHGLISPLIETLPDGVVGLGNGPQGLSIYWNERGAVEEVEALAKWLQQLQQLRLGS